MLMLMRSCRILLLLLAVSAAPMAQAQFVQCGAGTGTSIAGSVVAIDLQSGNVVFPSTSVNCGQTIPALAVNITSPQNGTSVFPGSSLNFQWTISNFNVSTDVCSMSVLPALPGTTWNLASVTPSSPPQPYAVSIPSGASPGQYSFRLSCTRDGSLASTSEVTLNVQPQPTCQGGSPPLPGMSLDIRTWQSIFQNPFGEPGPRPPYPGYALASIVNNPTTSIQVLAMSITAPQISSGWTLGQINQNLDNGQPFMFFSKCPGDISWSATRQHCGMNGIQLPWKLEGTNPLAPRCSLAPGEDYFVNVVFIDAAQAYSGQVRDICGAGTGSYSTTCYFWAAHHALSGIEPVTE